MQSQSMIYRGSRLAILASIPVLLTACASMDASGPKASAALEPRSGSQVAGTVSFQAVGQKVRVEARVAGLTPGEHGFHVHEAGDCSAADASSAKGHFNPAGRAHGHHGGSERHAGDMPNQWVGTDGVLRAQVFNTAVTLDPGERSIRGRALMIHAKGDDYNSQPSGNAGDRLACAPIPDGP